MSADACIAYYGLRYEVAPNEIEALERRSDPRMVAAREVDLKSFWANFAAPDMRYFLFVGTELGVLGPEGQSEVRIGHLDFRTVMESTTSKLRTAGLDGEPALYLQWYPDA